MAKVTLTGKLVNDELSLFEARVDYETIMGYWQGRRSLLTLLEKALESGGPMWSWRSRSSRPKSGCRPFSHLIFHSRKIRMI